MKNKTLGTAIDLCDLGLDQIDEDENEFRIGAYATLRQIETHEALNAYTHGAIAESVRHIVGVQFRNVATVGGSIWADSDFRCHDDFQGTGSKGAASQGGNYGFG